uniref:Uncharacterized protein n=1 Tax=Arundo donax TaxID=35708 RepID=A0A0A9HRV1_ARUDO
MLTTPSPLGNGFLIFVGSNSHVPNRIVRSRHRDSYVPCCVALTGSTWPLSCFFLWSSVRISQSLSVKASRSPLIIGDIRNHFCVSQE